MKFVDGVDAKKLIKIDLLALCEVPGRSGERKLTY